MIGKTDVGRSFGGLVNYLLEEKKTAQILEADGVNHYSKKSIIEGFNAMRKQLPTLGKAVWHSSISFAEGDKVSDDKMKEIAKDFMNEMGIKDTQYMIIKHNDTEHQHFHIVANRVNYQGKAISDSHSKWKTKDCCEKLTKKHGLIIAKDLKNERKANIKQTILQGIDQGKDFPDIMKDVERLGYKVQINKAKTGKISGVSYKNEEKGIVYKASEIDRKLSYGKIIKAIEEQKKQIKQGMTQDITKGKKGGISL